MKRPVRYRKCGSGILPDGGRHNLYCVWVNGERREFLNSHDAKKFYREQYQRVHGVLPVYRGR